MVETGCELTVETPALRVTVAAPREAAWKALRAAVEAVEGVVPPSVYIEGGTTPPGPGQHTMAGRIREIAREILADGRVHERREISKAVREAGIPAGGLDSALSSCFEKGANVKGRPTYRDRGVPSGYSTKPIPDDEKPQWMRDPAPAGPHHHGILNGGGSNP
jgi:hypothetical protein